MLARTLILWLISAVAAPPTMAPRPRPRAALRRAPKSARPRVKPLLRAAPPGPRQRRYRILGQLANPDAQLRADAAWQAGTQRITAAYKRLRKLLRDSDPLVRRNAAYALGRLGNPEAAIALVDRVPRERVPDVMVQLAIALGRLQHKSSRGFLVSLLFRRDAALRAAGIQALGYLREPGDVYTIGRFLRSKDAGERLLAATALGHLGSRFAIKSLTHLLSDPSAAVQRAVVESLAQLGARGQTRRLIQLLGKAPPPVKLALVRALSTLDAVAAIPHLSRLLAPGGSERLAAEAAQALAHLGGALPDKRLHQLLASRKNDVRIPAAQAAGLGGVRATIPQLTRLLSHPHPTLRLACAQALGRLAAHQSVDPLVARLRAEHGRLRAAYVRALGRMRAVTALPVLARLLRSSDARVVAAAASAIGEISRLDHRPVRPLTHQIALLMTVKRSTRVARAGALAFARLKPRKQRKGFARLLRLTLHRDPGVRAQAVRSLGLYGDRLATPTVLRLLGDDRVEVYSQAALAAAMLGRSQNYGTLQGMLNQTDPKAHPIARSRILLGIGMIDLSRRKEAARFIGDVLNRGPNTEAKADLVAAIAAVGHRWILPILQRARRSRCYLVRAAALRSLSIWPPPVAESKAAVAIRKRRQPKRPAMRAAVATPKQRERLSGPFPTPKARSKGCSCGSSSPGRSVPPLAWLLAGVGLALWRRRRNPMTRA